MAAGQSPGAAAASISSFSASAAPTDPSARWLTDADTVVSGIYHALPDSLLTSQAFITLHSLALPFALWFKPVCVFLALFWLIYRAAQVLNKPLDELASLLGFEIPLTPTIDLASVKADGALIHWNLPEKQKQKSSLKYEIHLNGTMIDAVSIHESAVTITGLHPGTFYVVRVALVTNLDFSSKSIPIRFRTKPASSGDCFVVAVDGHETDHDAAHEPVPRVRPYRGLKDISPALPVSATPGRDVGLGLTPRRLTNGRRVSPSAAEIRNEAVNDDGEVREGSGTIQQLTEKLDAIRRETDEAERQAKEEEEEERKQKDELAKERDQLKAEATEKERASRNLKREVNTLERQNTAAQNERAKQERLLSQKKQERKKLKDDMARWEIEMARMKEDVERIRQEQAEHLETVAQQKEELRLEQAEKTANLQSLDSEAKEKAAEVKKLERALKNNSPNGVEPDQVIVHQQTQDAEENRAWMTQRSALLTDYSRAFRRLENAKRFNEEQTIYLETLRAERAERRRVEEEVAQYASPPPTQDRLPRRADSQRSRPPHRHSISDSPRLANFQPSQSPFSGSMTNIASGGGPFSTAPFLNIPNDMNFSVPTEGIAMSDEDKEKLTGGALMSPGAGAELIPADLFSNEGENRLDRVRPLPGLGALPGLAGLPGPSPPPQLPPMTMPHDSPGQSQQGPASPVSASSRSPSVFASPRASLHNLHMGSPDNALVDADRRSIRSNRSGRAASGGGGGGGGTTGSRFSALFSKRSRTAAAGASPSDIDGPALGKASSMPRQDLQGGVGAGLDAADRKRTSSISGATLGGSAFTNDGGAVDGAAADSSTTAGAASSRRHFGLFSREKSGGWPSSFTAFGRRPASPRPGSTHSTELPRPSLDSSSRWGGVVDAWTSSSTTAGDAGNGSGGGSRSSPLAFGQGWNAPGQQSSRVYGSRHPSRRPSVQYGGSIPPEDILEDDGDDGSDMLEAGKDAHLAPIGTKPSKKQVVEDAASLNPNAKDFKSLFSNIKVPKSRESTGAPSSSSSGDKEKVSTPGPTSNPSFLLGGSSTAENDDSASSPPNSRKSRDTRSLNTTTTTESSLAAAEDFSLRNSSSDLVRTPSHTPSDAAAAAGGAAANAGAAPAAPSPSLAATTSKESFMDKLTRKSSSSRFSLPTFRPREKAAARVEGSPGAAAGPPAEEDEEDNVLSASVGSFRDFGREKEKEKDRGSGRNWSNVLKLSKSSSSKKSMDSPSVSGLSMTSGTGTEELDAEAEGEAQGLDD